SGAVSQTRSQHRPRFNIILPLASSATADISLAAAALAGKALHMARRSGRGCGSLFPDPFGSCGRDWHADRGLRPQGRLTGTRTTHQMAKRATIPTFVVEPTNHGWSVCAGTERMGLFATQRQALEEVKRRRAELTAKGQRSTIIVTGSESVT